MNNAYKKIQMKRTRLRNSYLKKENVRKKLLMICHRITIFPLQNTKRNYYTNQDKKMLQIVRSVLENDQISFI